MVQSWIGLIHTVAAIVALVLGAVVLLRPKAGLLHRRIGYGYAVSMAVVVVTAFCIYRLTGRFNVLHAAALLSTVTLAAGLSFAIRRKSGNWIEAHYALMSWSYIGLVAALVAEMATRVGMPWVVAAYGRSWLGAFWAIVAAATFLVCGVGAYLVRGNLPRVRAMAR